MIQGLVASSRDRVCWLWRIVLFVLPVVAWSDLGAQQTQPSSITGGARVTGAWTFAEMLFPAARELAVNFAVVPGGIPVVPQRGGLVVAGYSGWYVEPGARPIESVATAAGRVYITRPDSTGRRVELRAWRPEQRGATSIGWLPAGVYAIAAAPNGTVWAWGLRDGDRWSLWYADSASRLTPVTESDEPIRALAVSGPNAVVAAIGARLVLLRRGARPVQLAEATADIDGLAVDAAGVVYVSNRQGIYALVSPKAYVPIAHELHGPMQFSDGALYVLWRERHRVIRLARAPGAGELRPR